MTSLVSLLNSPKIFSREHTRTSAYFDFARAVIFDPIILNLVAIRPYIMCGLLNMYNDADRKQNK